MIAAAAPEPSADSAPDASVKGASTSAEPDAEATDPPGPSPTSPTTRPANSPPTTRPTPWLPGATAADPPARRSPGSSTTTPGATTPGSTAPESPPVPSELSIDVQSAGLLVRGRPGVLVASVRNDGAGSGAAAMVRLELTGATVRSDTGAAPIRAAGGGRPVPTSDGWSCFSNKPSTVDCTRDTVEAGASSKLFLPVAIPAGGTSVGVEASVTASHDTGGAASSPSITLPVDATGMAARFATVERGAVTTTGNTLATCRDTDPGCAQARAGGPGAPDNGSLVMVPVDVDGDPSTANSSTARLDLTGGADVLSASLYWSAGLGAGTGGEPAPNPSAKGKVVLRSPSGNRATVTAERVDSPADSSRYQAVADVTNLVRNGGAGDWTVGDVQAGTGTNTYAGWSLVVAYRDPSLPSRSLVVLDGFTGVEAGQSVSFSVGGFVVPSSGASAALVDVVTYEGDTTLNGDQLSVNGVALSDAANPLGNSFNSTATDRGQARSGRSPGWANLLGIDLDRFDVTSALQPGSTSATITFSTDDDRFLTGVVAFSVDQ